MKSHSYAILGTGALGGLYGGLLAKAGFEVHFLLNSDFEHVRAHGLRVDSPLGDFVLPQVNVHRWVNTIPRVDVVIVAWKTTANGQLAELLPALVNKDTVFLVLQNGWDIEIETADVVGADQVLGGCCFLCSNKIGPGHIHHLDYGRIIFGEYSQQFAGEITPRAEQIAAEFRSAKIDMTASPDLRNTRWRKLMWNIPFNGLSVVLNAATDEIMGNPFSAALAETLVREVRQAAHRYGTEIEESFVDKMLSDTQRMVPYASSMLIDYRSGREMEVEAIFGNPLRTAERLGFDAVNLRMLYRQLSFINDRRTRPAKQSSIGENCQ